MAEIEMDLRDVSNLAVSGSRYGASWEQLKAFRDLLEGFDKNKTKWLHHGSCIGFDEEAVKVAKFGYNFKIHTYPPLRRDYYVDLQNLSDRWEQPFSYSGRNQRLVLASEVLFAAPRRPRWEGGGTWNAVSHAERSGVTFIVVSPSGHLIHSGGKLLRQLSSS